MPGDLPVAVIELIFAVPITGTLTPWQSLLSAPQLADLAHYTPVDGFIQAPATDGVVRNDGFSRPSEFHTIPAGAVWQMPSSNWLQKGSVKSLSGGAATVTLVIYAQ